jgi:hypothetical protein
MSADSVTECYHRHVMSWRWGVPGVHAVVPVVAVLALAAGCDSTPSGHAAGTPAATTPATTPATTAAGTTDTSTVPAIPSFTPPPRRHLSRPPGVGRVPGSACDPASIAVHFFIAAWYSGVASYAVRGESVPDFQWADAARVLPGFRSGVARSRVRLLAAGVPRGFVVFQDLADADGAVREGVAAAKAKDDSKVLPVYFTARTAEKHLVESCSVLE